MAVQAVEQENSFCLRDAALGDGLHAPFLQNGSAAAFGIHQSVTGVGSSLFMQRVLSLDPEDDSSRRPLLLKARLYAG